MASLSDLIGHPFQHCPVPFECSQGIFYRKLFFVVEVYFSANCNEMDILVMKHAHLVSECNKNLYGVASRLAYFSLSSVHFNRINEEILRNCGEKYEIYKDFYIETIIVH
ncbi:hypothetical protein TNIN_165761 [Trichonephila inaurata madagascariensis]|uniref:Uncharacterized protein n=1 Tax=Trichonephila inaurata madagascariensis TaxID=2747483 RepID=A0A8X7CD27_9ARAC|nr:hypothetical protein TNIN_165761 [Trichonephila inaurata madagascariensis]